LKLKTSMKVMLLICALCAALVCPAAAAGGGADDPLISQSYIDDVFLPALEQRLQNAADAAVSDYTAQLPAAVRGMKTLQLAAGDSLTLGSGQQFVLLGGGAVLRVNGGTVINATAGRTSSGGDVRQGNRYILGGSASASVTVADSAVISVSVGATGVFACPFTDVVRTDWYFADVSSAYQRGLVNGMTATSYAPKNTLTNAQAVKLAACMHQLYREGAVALENAADGRAWYMSYVDYAKRNAIMDTLPQNYDAAITRADFIRLFYNTMPESEYTRKNLIMDGAIPDIATDAPLAKQVYTFYMAGILTGYPADGTHIAHAFGANSTITRAEVATIMNRMFTPSARVAFTMD